MKRLLLTLRWIGFFLLLLGALQLLLSFWPNVAFVPITTPSITFLVGVLFVGFSSFSSRHNLTEARLSRSSIIGAVVLLVACLSVLGWRYLQPDGEYYASYSFAQPDGAQPISGLGPGGRVSSRLLDPATHTAYQQMRKDLTYFTVDLPREFSDIHVKLTYKNPVHQSLTLGLQTATSDWSFERRILELKAVDEAARNSWTRLELDEHTSAYVRPELADLSLPELASSPDVQIGLFETPRPLYRLPDQIAPPSADKETYVAPLRGSHDIYFYLSEGESFSFESQFDRLDPAFDFPPLSLRLSRFGEDIAFEQNTVLQDPDRDRIVMETDPLPEGVYRLHVESTDRVILRSFTTPNNRFIFKSLTLAASPDYLDEIPDIPIHPTTLYSTSSSVRFQTVHDVGLQTIVVDSESFQINQTNKFYEWTSDTSSESSDQLRSFYFPVSDMNIRGDEWFSFSSETYFDPDYETLQLSTTTIEEAKELDVLLFPSSYVSNTSGNVTRDAPRTVAFPLHTLYLEDPTQLQFVLTSPGFQIDETPIAIERIEVRAYKPPLSLSRIWNRLTGGSPE